MNIPPPRPPAGPPVGNRIIRYNQPIIARPPPIRNVQHVRHIGEGRLKNGTKTGTMWEARDFSVSDINRLRKLLHSETLNELLDRGYAYNVFSWRIIKLYKEAWYAMLAKLGYPHDYTFHDVARRMIREHERHYGIVPSIVEINDAIQYPARRNDERRIERDIEREILDELGAYNIEPRRRRDREEILRQEAINDFRRHNYGRMPTEQQLHSHLIKFRKNKIKADKEYKAHIKKLREKRKRIEERQREIGQRNYEMMQRKKK